MGAFHIIKYKQNQLFEAPFGDPLTIATPAPCWLVCPYSLTFLHSKLLQTKSFPPPPFPPSYLVLRSSAAEDPAHWLCIEMISTGTTGQG